MNWDRVERLIGSDNLSRLARARVGVVGLGSGGGFAALSLAMSGVKQFVLVDDDILEETNIVRHVADRSFLGQPKAEAMKTLILRRNPEAEIDVRVGLIEDHMDALDDLDLLVVGVDKERVKYVINEAAMTLNLPAIYAGVYERGEGGDIALIKNYRQGPCYACWAAELREGLALSDIVDGGTLDYGMIGEDGTLESEPALWLHVVKVAAAQADLALNELLTGSEVHATMPGNTVILANRTLEILEGVMTPPYGSVWVTIPRDPSCLVCGDAAKLTDASEADSGMSLADLMDATGMTLEDDE